MSVTMKGTLGAAKVQLMDVMEFFQLSTGTWRSQRTTHHLAFRRAEVGESEILVEALPADHSKIVEICQLHNVDPQQAIGGAFVSWQGAMGWDKEDENHQGSTIFALIPEVDHLQRGILLRERGYAEVVPVAGEYHIDADHALVLTTEYETMSSIERFWFASPNLRMRTSTVKRFGGFSTATFCTEFRVEEANLAEVASAEAETTLAKVVTSANYISSLGW